MNPTENKEWDLVILPKRKLFDLRLHEVREYWDLLALFVKKDIITIYKQTILGPLWFVIQPLLSSLVYIFIFGSIAKIPTGVEGQEVDKLPFYLAGVTLWTVFSSSFIMISNTFTMHMNVFEKVYFPRIIIPLSKLASSYIKYFIQFGLFLVFFLYYFFKTGKMEPNWTILLLPVYLLIIGGLGLGAGLILSALTTKYRDLKFLLSFGIQLLMYGTTVVYPLSFLTGNAETLVRLNPITYILEAFRYSFLGSGSGVFDVSGIIYAAICMIVVLFSGIIIFNKTEQNFIDTV